PCTETVAMALTPVVELGVSEAYEILTGHFGVEDLPPLDCLDHEDWGRDYLLSRFLDLPPSALAEAGLCISVDDLPQPDGSSVRLSSLARRPRFQTGCAPPLGPGSSRLPPPARRSDGAMPNGVHGGHPRRSPSRVQARQDGDPERAGQAGGDQSRAEVE